MLFARIPCISQVLRKYVVLASDTMMITQVESFIEITRLLCDGVTWFQATSILKLRLLGRERIFPRFVRPGLVALPFLDQ